MIAVISTLIMFLCFFTGALIHLINRQSKSYVLLAGYFLGCLILCIEVSRINHFIDFGVWVLPFGLICIGELLRFHQGEKYFSDKLKSVLDRKNLSVSFKSFYDLPIGIGVPLFTFEDVFIIYKSKYDVIAKVSLKDSLEFSPEDFNIFIKLISGHINIEYKDMKHTLTSSGTEFVAGTLLQLTPMETSVIEITLRKRAL